MTELLDVEGIDRVVIVGLSLGGGVALRTALDFPERVAGLVLCAPYGVGANTPWGWVGYLMVHAPGLNAITWRLVRSSDAVASWSLRSMLHRTAPSPELIAMVQAAARPGASRAWTGFQRRETRWSGPRTYFGAALSRVTCPATVLAGERDMLVHLLMCAPRLTVCLTQSLCPSQAPGTGFPAMLPTRSRRPLSRCSTGPSSNPQQQNE